MTTAITTASEIVAASRDDPTLRIPEVAGRQLAASVDGILNRHAAVGFGIGVVRDGRLAGFVGRGFADAGLQAPVTEDTVFRIASITKTFTAIAVMQLVEEGLVDLDAPANDYLRAYKLVPARADFRPATVRHLLTHTAGIGEVVRTSDLVRPDWGDSVPPGQPVPTLAQFYAEGIPIDVEPGTTFTYTNHGFATLGQIVEEVSGLPLDRYFRERIFEPLGMTDTGLAWSERLGGRRATGYRLTRRGPEPLVDRDWVTVGASSIVSTIRDMARYAAALMGGGTNDHGSILRPETLATMFEAHFRLDPRVPGMGLGFDRNPSGSHLVVGHGGILPGFNSHLFVAPDDGVGVIAFVTGANLAMLWLPTELARLLNGLLGIPEPTVRADLPQHPETWPALCGLYGFPGRLTDIRARLMTGLGGQVFVRGDELRLRLFSPVPGFLAGLRLVPDDERDPDVFRADLGRYGLPTARVVFSRGPDGGATAIHFDLFPASLPRRPVPAAARRRVARSIAISAVASSAIAAGRAADRLRRRARSRARVPA
jgi:CubicO group peptidase (beta-lactamase class C family)